MSAKSNLLDLDEDSNWLENDDDLTIKPDGTKPYTPVEDIDFNIATTPEVNNSKNIIGNDQSSHPVIQSNFEGGLLSINHYRRYFNISTSDFISNVFNSLNFLKNVENEEEIGDFYGPLWVTATVIFILFFSNTSSGLLVSWISGSDEAYQYNFNLLTGAISLLYGYTVIIPLVFYLISVFYFKLTNFFNLSKIISIYGYANSAWAPAAVLSILRGFLVNHKVLSEILKWTSVLVGGILSGVSIVLKIYPVVKNSSLIQGKESLAIVLVGLLGVAHLGFIIAVKVLFFGDLNVV